MNPMRFKIRPASGGWRVIYYSVNGRTVVWTQVYKSLWSARRAVILLKLYAATAPVKIVSTRLRQAS